LRDNFAGPFTSHQQAKETRIVNGPTRREVEGSAAEIGGAVQYFFTWLTNAQTGPVL
jgi:hypothetical protein